MSVIALKRRELQKICLGQLLEVDNGYLLAQAGARNTFLQWESKYGSRKEGMYWFDYQQPPIISVGDELLRRGIVHPVREVPSNLLRHRKLLEGVDPALDQMLQWYDDGKISYAADF